MDEDSKLILVGILGVVTVLVVLFVCITVANIKVSHDKAQKGLCTRTLSSYSSGSRNFESALTGPCALVKAK